MLEKGARIICEFVGKAPNPMNLFETLRATAEYLKTKIQWVVSAGYWVLKFATKTVLMLATIPFLPLVGLWKGVSQNPHQVQDFLIGYEDAIDQGFGMLESLGSSSKKPEVAKAPKNYFADDTDLERRTFDAVNKIIESYFMDKILRETDVKPEGVTSRIKDQYKKLEEMAKSPHADGTAAYAAPTYQIGKINDVITVTTINNVRTLGVKRVNMDTVKCVGGTVDFKYLDEGKAKTKGFFGGWFS